MAASTAFFGTIHALTSIKDIIIEIDSQLTSIRKVMTEDTNVDTLLSTANEQAQELGRTLSGVLSAMEVFGKMGFNQLDTEFLSRSAMLLSTVGEMEDADSANALIAAIRQYKMEISDATKIIDVWNQLSNTAGTTSQELANGVAKAGSSANMAGVDFEILSSQIATITETMKIGGKEAGNFLKSFYNRILRSSTLSELEAVGVATKDTNEQLLAADQIIQNLSEKWDTFGKQQQNALAQQLGGVYHVNKVSTLLENQERTLENLNNAYNSHNSAAEELKIFQESIVFSINQLKASWENLALTMGSDGGFEYLIRTTIKGLKLLTDGFTELTDATDGWNVKLPILIGLGYGAIRMFQALRVAATTAQLSMGWVGVGVVGIQLLATAFMGTTSAMDLNTEAVMKNAQENQTNANNLRELVERHDQLKQEVEQGANKQEELRDVLNSIRKIAPHLIELTGEYGDKLELNKEKTDTYIKSLEQMSKEQLQQAKTLAQMELSKANLNVDEIESELSEVADTVNDKFSTVMAFWDDFKVSGINDAKEKINSMLDELWEQRNEIMANGDPLLLPEIDSQIENLQKRLFDYLNLMEDDSIAEFVEQNKLLREETSKRDGIVDRIDVIDQMIAGTYEGSDAVNGFTESLDDETDSLEDSTEATWEKVSATEALLGVTDDQIEKTKQAIKIVSLLSHMENLNAQQKEMLSGATAYLEGLYPHLTGRIYENIDAIIAEVDVYSELNNASGANADVMMANQDSITKATIDASNQRILALQKEAKALQDVVDAYVRSQLDQYGLVAENGFIKNIINNRIPQVNAQLSEAYETRRKALYDGYTSSGGSSKSSTSSVNNPANKSAIDALIRQFNYEQQLLSLDSEKIKKQIEIAKTQGDINKQLELTQKLTENENKRISELRKVNDLLHNQANIIRDANKQYDTSKWFDQDNNETVEFIKQFNKASKEQQEHMMEVFTSLQKLKNAYGESSSEIINLRDSMVDLNEQLIKLTKESAQQKLDAITSTEQKVIEMIRHRVQVEKDALRETLSEYEKYINDKINLLNKEANEEDYQRQLAKEQEELMRLNKLLNEQILDDSLSSRNKQRELREKIGTQEEKIAEMQRKNALDDQIDNLQKLMDEERKRVEEKEKELDEQLENDKLYAEARKAIETGYLRWLVRETDGTYRQVNGIVETTMTSLTNAYTDFENVYGQGLSALGSQIKNDFIANIKTAQQEIRNLTQLFKDANMDIGSSTGSSSILGSGQAKKDNMNLLWAKFVNDMLMTNSSIKSNGRSVAALGSMRDTIVDKFITDRSQTIDPNNTKNFNQLFSSLSATEKQELVNFLKQQLLSGRISDPKNISVVQGILGNLPMFESGGLLGKWSGGAKLAGLHPEELILDKEHTSKFADLMGKLDANYKNFIPNITVPKLGERQQGLTLQIGSLIGNVEGNLDHSVLPEVQRMVDNSFDKLKRQFNKSGISRRV